jgi:ubiquinone/menaquinone biosynthesis C-methylase UbiE
MKVQDKKAEMDVGSVVPDDEWLDDKRTYRIKRTHLELLKVIPLQGRLILDAGCGPGTYGIILAEEGNDVIGIDISTDFVRKARDRGNQKALRFWPQIGDLERLPFKDNSFEVCFSGWVLHHFPDLDPVCGELYRVLKPGGVIALAEPNESSVAARLSRFVEDLPLIRQWVLRVGWDTPNRAVHTHDKYMKTLERQGFADIRVGSCFPGMLPPLPGKAQKRGSGLLIMFFLHVLFHLRRLIFIPLTKIFPGPLNGTDLLITATKKD